MGKIIRKFLKIVDLQIKLYIKIKQKKPITNVYFETNRENIPSSQASFYIEEYKNFDISIEQAR